MTHKERSVEDYLEDEHFVRSVLYPGESNSISFDDLEENNQANSSNMELAKKILLNLKVEEKEILAESIKANLNTFRVANNVSEGNNNEDNSKTYSLASNHWMKWAAAAAVVLATGITIFYNK